MELSLNIDPVIVRDQHGEVILNAALFDLFYLIGAVMVRPEVKAMTSNNEQMQAIADELNQVYKTSLTWGAAKEIVVAVESEVMSLKKNGKGVDPSASSPVSQSPSDTSPESPSSTSNLPSVPPVVKKPLIEPTSNYDT